MTQVLEVMAGPTIQRDLYLSRCLKSAKHRPSTMDSINVLFDDGMLIQFNSDSPTTSCVVSIDKGISIHRFTQRIEMLLDCASTAVDVKLVEGEPWILKYSGATRQFGNNPVLAGQWVARTLCDRIAVMTDKEIIGALKCKRRAISVGHAKIRVDLVEGLFQVVVRHKTAQGLKALWKSIQCRLCPAHPSQAKKDKMPAEYVDIGMDANEIWETLKRMEAAKVPEMMTLADCNSDRHEKGIDCVYQVQLGALQLIKGIKCLVKEDNEEKFRLANIGVIKEKFKLGNLVKVMGDKRGYIVVVKNPGYEIGKVMIVFGKAPRIRVEGGGAKVKAKSPEGKYPHVVNGNDGLKKFCDLIGWDYEEFSGKIGSRCVDLHNDIPEDHKEKFVELTEAQSVKVKSDVSSGRSEAYKEFSLRSSANLIPCRYEDRTYLVLEDMLK